MAFIKLDSVDTDLLISLIEDTDEPLTEQESLTLIKLKEIRRAQRAAHTANVSRRSNEPEKYDKTLEERARKIIGGDK